MESDTNIMTIDQHEAKSDSLPSTAPNISSALAPMVQAVMSGKMTPETLQQLLDVQKDFEKNEAEKAFYRAHSEFKKHSIKLVRDKLVSFETTKGTTEYRHTTLGKALEVINPLLSKYGLSLTWETVQDFQNGGLITVTCVLSHTMGFSKKTPLSASPDQSGGKNNIQAIGSTVSYLERYTAFSLLGLASMDQDDDAVSAGAKVEYITEEQAKEINAMLSNNKINKEKFLSWLRRSLKADCIERITVQSRDEVIRQINASIKHQQKPA